MGGSRQIDTNLPANLILVHGSGTTGCHGLMESQREKAIRRGFNIRQGLTPTEVPVFVLRMWTEGWFRLDNFGNRTLVPSADAVEYMHLIGAIQEAVV